MRLIEVKGTMVCTMSMQSEATPFARLGKKLKVARQSMQETLAEVAGAVEIAEEELRSIERGTTRPSEEILMLLIQHFEVQEDEAVKLWELAGYEKETEQNEAENVTKTIVMAINFDSRVIYSDHVIVNGNRNGIVLNFIQPSAANIPQIPISRVGMSREHGWQLLKVLHDTLVQLDKNDTPKQLPPTTQDKK